MLAECGQAIDNLSYAFVLCDRDLSLSLSLRFLDALFVPQEHLN
jgi:hypothetical protein